MKSEQLFYAITDIQDRFIEEASGGVPKQNRQIYMRYGVLAASLLIVCGLGGISLRSCGNQSNNSSGMPNTQISDESGGSMGQSESIPLPEHDVVQDGNMAAEDVLPNQPSVSFDTGEPANIAPPSNKETAPKQSISPSLPQSAGSGWTSPKSNSTEITPETPLIQAAPYAYVDDSSNIEEGVQSSTENDDATLQTAKSYAASAGVQESVNSESDYARDVSNSGVPSPTAMQPYPVLFPLSLAEGNFSAAREVILDLSTYPETGLLHYQDCYTIKNTTSSTLTLTLLYPDKDSVSIAANGKPLTSADIAKITVSAGENVEIIISGNKALPASPDGISSLEVISSPSNTLDFTSQSVTLVPCSGLELSNQNIGFDIAADKLSVPLKPEESPVSSNLPAADYVYACKIFSMPPDES